MPRFGLGRGMDDSHRIADRVHGLLDDGGRRAGREAHPYVMRGDGDGAHLETEIVGVEERVEARGGVVGGSRRARDEHRPRRRKGDGDGDLYETGLLAIDARIDDDLTAGDAAEDAEARRLTDTKTAGLGPGAEGAGDLAARGGRRRERARRGKAGK